MRSFIVMLAFAILTACSYQHNNEKKLAEYNPHGVVLRTKKAFTVVTPNAGPVTFYTLFAINVPPRKKFFLQVRDCLSENQPLLALTSDDAGRLWLSDNKKIPLDRFPLIMNSLMPGETLSLWLVTENRNMAVSTKIIPYPLEAFGSDGAEISVTRVIADGKVVDCKGRYFQPNEKLQLHVSARGHTYSQAITCADATFAISIAPPDTKSYGAVVTVQVERENGDILTVSYPWGREIYNKNHLMANPQKFQEEDYKKLYDAAEEFYLPHASPHGLT